MEKQNLISFGLALILFSSVGEVFSDNTCEGDWTAYKDEKCVRIFNTEIESYDEAESFCKGKWEANLVSIGFEDKQKFLEDFLKSNGIVDNVWIGLRYGNNGNYVWSDNSDFVYSNWGTGSPRNDSAYCVQIEAEDATFGKWVEVQCTRRNVVLCEKVQPWSLSQLQSEFMNLKKNLIPIGFIYVQFPKEKPPVEIWSWMTWKDVTADYAGVFFRAEGGNSSAFGSVQEDASPRLIKSQVHASVTSGKDDKRADPEFEIPADGVYHFAYHSTFYDAPFSGFQTQNLMVSASEVRPRNMAVRIWKRIR